MRLAEEASRIVVVRTAAAPSRSRWNVFAAAAGSRILLQVVYDDSPLVKLLVIAPPSVQNVKTHKKIRLFSNYRPTQLVTLLSHDSSDER